MLRLRVATTINELMQPVGDGLKFWMRVEGPDDLVQTIELRSAADVTDVRASDYDRELDGRVDERVRRHSASGNAYSYRLTDPNPERTRWHMSIHWSCQGRSKRVRRIVDWSSGTAAETALSEEEMPIPRQQQ